MPEVQADLCFLGDEADPGNTVPVFVMRERLTMTLAAAVLRSPRTLTSPGESWRS